MSRIRLALDDGDAIFEVERGRDPADPVTVVDPAGVQRALRLEDLGGGRALVALDEGLRTPVWFARDDEAIFVHAFGRTMRFELAERTGQRRARRRGGGGDLRTPMPGVITRVLVAVGDVVDAGTPLYGLEAMKMESLIKAPAAARVTEVLAAEGDQVEGGVDIVRVAPVEPADDAGEQA